MKIMACLAKETNGKSYNTFKYSYDRDGIPSMDYDDDGKQMSWASRPVQYSCPRSIEVLLD